LTTQTTPPRTAPPRLQTCDVCDAPLDGLQRYCLNCGQRSRYIGNPALDFLVAKRKPSRLAPKNEVAAGSGGSSDKVAGIPRDAIPWLFGGISLALIFGVLFGSVLGGGNNDDLIAALKSQPQQVAAVAAVPTGATAAATTTLTSDYSLDNGYAIQITTLPAEGTDQAAADAAKKAATDKGAAKVGLISQTDFTVTPAPDAGAYVVYSGEFKKKDDATKALGKLKKKFPEASVIAVKKTASDDSGTVLGKGSDGKTAHSLQGYKPSEKKKASDKKAVDDLQNKTGDDYRQAQKDLPAEITIPKDPNATGGPTGTDN
jgi:hypothetical protein